MQYNSHTHKDTHLSLKTELANPRNWQNHHKYLAINENITYHWKYNIIKFISSWDLWGIYIPWPREVTIGQQWADNNFGKRQSMCLSVSSSNFLSSINERPTAQTDDSQCYIFQKTKMRLILSGFCRHPFTPLRASPPGHSNFLSHNTMSRKMRQKKARITCILISNTFVLAPFVNSVRRIPYS